ncbi:MAG: hypothetical protein UU61_C0042G0006 [Parcubacteria group bacterium GW2011_GWB1_41_4]|nr:MAG: hypothetical protein UU61_C0042G0006 [Parcubacteria group bacterium GW2011_GWB1_41_4]
MKLLKSVKDIYEIVTGIGAGILLFIYAVFMTLIGQGEKIDAMLWGDSSQD